MYITTASLSTRCERKKKTMEIACVVRCVHLVTRTARHATPRHRARARSLYMYGDDRSPDQMSWTESVDGARWWWWRSGAARGDGDDDDEEDPEARRRCFQEAVRSIWHMPSATRSAGPPRLSMRQKAMCARTASSTSTGARGELFPASYFTASEHSPHSHLPPKYALTPPTYSPVHSSSSPQHSQLITTATISSSMLATTSI